MATKKNQTSFKPGQTGNPAGRPPGTTPRAKFRKMIDPDLPEILKALVTAAKGGDVAAIKVIYDRVVPNLRPSSEDMSIRVCGTLSEQGASIVAAMTDGKITPDQAKAAMDVILAQSHLVDATDVIARLDQLEALVCGTTKP